MNGAEALIRTAVASGVEVCFANPGTTELHLVAALDAVPGIRAVLGLFSLVYLLPLFVVIFNSFRPLPEILQNGLIAFPRSIGFSRAGAKNSTLR